MSKLWYLLAASMLLAAIIENRDWHLRDRYKRDRREKLFTFFLILLLGTFCGLRTWFNDTVTYLQMYAQTTSLAEFLVSGDKSFAHGIGFKLINSVLKDWGFSSQDYLMFYAFATVIPYVLFVRRYAPSFVFAVFLMFATGFYTFSFAAIKQCVAIGICLLAVSAAVDRKWFRFFLLVGLASTFHPYALIYLLVPFFFFRPWTSKTYLYIVLFLAAGFYLDTLLNTVVDITDMMGANYTTETFVGEGVNIFRVLVAFVPLVLSVPYKRTLFTDSSRTDNLMFNLAMLNALIMFVGLFGTANYFARLANYFLPAQVIVLPWMIKKIGGQDGQFLKLACIGGYTGYFIYENAILKKFDEAFSQTSLWGYLLELLR